MAIKDYLEKREIQLIIIVGALVAILLLYQVGPFLAYGIPAVTFHTVSQTKPVSKSVNIGNSYGDWQAFKYYEVTEAKWESLIGKRYVQVALDVTIGVKVEVTDLMLSGFLTEIKPPPFLIEETETNIYYKNMTIHAYAYGFKVTLAWTGTSQVTILEEGDWGLIPPTVPSREDMVKTCVKDLLVPDFNENCYVAANLLMSIDAPTLASDKAYELRPDYMGMCGMWLADYQTIGYTTGTATEALPASTGTAVKLFRDKALTSPCWAPDYDTSLGKPLLTPDVVYWLQNFAAQSAWWKTTIIHLGSQLAYDKTKPHPNYISWAWEKYGESDEPPAIAQWFRVDIAFRVTEDWTVPKIPEYELPPEEKEKMRIIVTVEPENIGVPLNPPSVDVWTLNLSELIWIFAVIFVGTIATIMVYYYVKGKWGVVK